MEPQFIQEFLLALWRELCRKRLVATLAFCLTSLIVLCVGIVWPLKYQTSATLYVDERNILEPLLEGQAEVQNINQAEEAKDKIYTRRILEKVARDANLITDEDDSKKIAATIARLGAGALGGGGGIQIRNNGKNYIQISYQDSDPDVSFNVITALINAFIRNIAESKRIESKKAYDFIQSQVDIYKEQLKKAEENLKIFNAENRDGTESMVDTRITTLRSEIEELNLQIDEIRSRRETIRAQLLNEKEYLNVRTQSDVYRQRIKDAQSRLQTLLISLTDTHPDVVSLKLQIEDHTQAILDIEQQELSGNTASNNEAMPLNPLYEELRSNLSDTEIRLNAAIHREATLSNLLQEEYKRAERIAGRQASLSELTRDYNVTKNLYEDMLGSKEKARLSMTLDIEGQGISYKIHEPPTYPLAPSGLNAKHFVLLGPLAGLLAPIGLIGVFIFLDPRIRLPSDLDAFDGVEVLALTGPIKNTASDNRSKTDNFFAVVLLVFSAGLYSWIAMTKIIGVV